MSDHPTTRYVLLVAIFAAGSLCTLTGYALNERPELCRTYAKFYRYHRHGPVTHLEIVDGRIVETMQQRVRPGMFVCLDDAKFVDEVWPSAAQR